MPALLQVFPVRVMERKILWSVIGRLMVQMVDHFSRTKSAPKHLLHHEQMLQDIAVLPGARMIGSAYQYIAFFRFNVPTALPIGIQSPTTLARSTAECAFHRARHPVILPDRLPALRAWPQIFHALIMA